MFLYRSGASLFDIFMDHASSSPVNFPRVVAGGAMNDAAGFRPYSTGPRSCSLYCFLEVKFVCDVLKTNVQKAESVWTIRKDSSHACPLGL
jgi:hypothetical protein